ncbi:hypothetical protein ABPG75_013749 [Micractinium tetrahymenae]
MQAGMRAALAVLLLAAGVAAKVVQMPTAGAALRCSRTRPCSDKRSCCSVTGRCGRTAAYCAARFCLSGPCWRLPPPPAGKPCCTSWGVCGTKPIFCNPAFCVSGPCSTPALPPPPPPPRAALSPRPPTVPALPPPPGRPPPGSPLTVTSPPPPAAATRPPPPPLVLRSSPPLPAVRPSPPPPVIMASPPPLAIVASPPPPIILASPPPPVPAPSPPPPSPPPPPPPPSPAPAALPTFPSDLGDATTQYSWLWGREGELWSPTGRMPDYSYTGYMANEASIPDYPTMFNVLNYGAKGDGVADDTKAIVAAIAAASQAAAKLSSVDCGTPLRPKSCPAATNGFGNEGRAGVAVLLPAGRYKVTGYVEIMQSNVVVRGEGINKTTLYFPKPLSAIYGNQMQWSYMGGFLTFRGRRNDASVVQYQLARITSPARKGERRLQVASSAGVTVGKWVRLYAVRPSGIAPYRRRLMEDTTDVASAPAAAPAPAQQPLADSPQAAAGPSSAAPTPGPAPGPAELEAAQSGAGRHRRRYRRLPAGLREVRREARRLGLGEPEHGGMQDNSTDGSGATVPVLQAAGTLDAYLYGQNVVDSASAPFSGERIRFVSRVTAVGPGWVELERPLLYDVRPEWQVYIYSFETPLQHVGYENFTVEFQHDVYPGHFQAKGYNAFWAQSAANSWVRDIRIIDADNGGEAINCDFMTYANISVEVTAPRGGKNIAYKNGHHGFWAAASSNVLFTSLNFKTQFIHDLTFDVFAQECAFTNITGVDINLDMHRSGNHNNLFSNIVLGAGLRPFDSSGDAGRGAHAAANNTWWNVRSASGATVLPLPSCDYGALETFVLGSVGPPERGDWGIGPVVRTKALSADSTHRVVGAASSTADAAAAGGDVSGAASSGSAASNATVDAATAARPYSLFPGYCAARVGWWVEQVRPGAALYPPDLHYAMVATRRQRLSGGQAQP